MSADPQPIESCEAIPPIRNNGSSIPKDEIAHVLFLDIVGFTKLKSVKQRLVLGKLQEIVRATEDFCAAKTEGHLIALPTGDGMALVFLTKIDGAGPAISCAEKIAEAVSKYNQSTTDEAAKIKVRIGIHSGNVVRVADVNDRENVAGEGINTAQRVMDCGDVGHILLSNYSYNFLPTGAEPDRREQCVSLGKVKVKHDQEVLIFNLVHDQIGNSETPQKIKLQADESERFRTVVEEIRKREQRRRKILAAVFGGIIIGILGFVFWWMMRTSEPKPSLAVLPFTPISQKNSSKAVSKGFTEQFIRSFGILTRINPQSLNTVKDVLKQNSATISQLSRLESAVEAGKKLNARYVLTGTIESHNDDSNLNNLTDANADFAVDVQAELYDTQNGKLVWNESYPLTPFNRLTLLHRTIIDKVTDVMGVVIQTNVEIDRLVTNKSLAYWYYMLGRFYSTERTNATDPKQLEEITKKAIWNYEKSIEMDQSYALAQAGLADIYVSIGGTNIAPTEAKDKALKATEDALNWFDECPAEVYGSIGTEKWWLERNFSIANVAFRLAVKTNPDLADSHKRYSSYLAAQGKVDEAEKEIQRALTLEPESTIFRLTSGQNYFFAERYDQAIVQLQKLIATDPKPAAYRFLAMALEQKNLNEQALEQLQKSASKCEEDWDCLGALGHIKAHMNQRDEAIKIAQQLENLKKTLEDPKSQNKSYVSPYNIAVIYAAIPDKADLAFQWLDKAIEEFDPRVTWLKVDPRFRELGKSRTEDFRKRLRTAKLIS